MRLDVNSYLHRLGISPREVSLDADFLKKLQYAHVLTVPYENLDIINGIPISLDKYALFEKIVTRGRGGYCFEVNGLLSFVLMKLGFKVHNYAARYLRGVNEIPVRRHRVLVVEIGDEKYLCDVGIGQSAPRFPLKLEEAVCEQFGEVYRFESDPLLGWKLCDLHNGEWRPFYSFTEEDQLNLDFIQPSFYCEKHPDSPFNKDIMVAIKTEKGRKSLNGRVYKEFNGDDLTYIEEDISKERLYFLLEKEFGINWRYSGDK